MFGIVSQNKDFLPEMPLAPRGKLSPWLNEYDMSIKLPPRHVCLYL